MQAEKKQFFIEKPKKYNINDNIEEEQIFKYYFDGFEKEKDIISLVEVLKMINKKYKVVLRKHPRYRFHSDIDNLIKEFKIEDNKFDIRASILESKFICAKYSTVLLEGYFPIKI